jgi:putative salt-induced outer membrane protein YdiY
MHAIVCVAGFFSGQTREEAGGRCRSSHTQKNNTNKKRTEMKQYRNLICLAAFAALAASAFGQSAPTAPLNTGWITSASFGFSLAKGNSDTMLATGNLLSSKKWDRNEMDLGTDGTYGETDGVRSAGNIHGFAQYNRLFTERFFGLMRVDAVNDSVANVDYRLTLSPGVGYYFIKNTNTFLRAEAGPGFVFERVGGVTDDYVTLRLAERFETKLNDTVKLWQSVEFLPAFEDFSSYVINAEIGIDTSLTKKLSLRTFVQDTYDSTPAAGLKKNDVKLVAAIAYKF